MKPKMSGDEWFARRAAKDGAGPDQRAPARLKARTFTALIRAQEESGPLEDLSVTKRQGRPLCVFEELVQVSPVGQQVKSLFYCRVCHARVLAEQLERAPIYWPHCPYVRFQNR